MGRVPSAVGRARIHRTFMTIGRGAIVAGGAVIVTAWVIASGPGPDRAPEAQRKNAAAASLTPVVPDLQLLGIAEDTREGQPSRTAVISAMDGLFLVHEGEPIALRYQVRKIGADAVELEDLAAGTTIRLALR